MCKLLSSPLTLLSTNKGMCPESFVGLLFWKLSPVNLIDWIYSLTKWPDEVVCTIS